MAGGGERYADYRKQRHADGDTRKPVTKRTQQQRRIRQKEHWIRMGEHCQSNACNQSHTDCKAGAPAAWSQCAHAFDVQHEGGGTHDDHAQHVRAVPGGERDAEVCLHDVVRQCGNEEARDRAGEQCTDRRYATQVYPVAGVADVGNLTADEICHANHFDSLAERQGDSHGKCRSGRPLACDIGDAAHHAIRYP
jgi:hypothetical protein